MWAKSINHFGNFGRHFPTRHPQKSSQHVRAPHRVAQFVLKIEKLSHIMGTTPILEMARTYSLRPRLWLLASCNSHGKSTTCTFLLSASGFPVIIRFQPAPCNLHPAKYTCRGENYSGPFVWNTSPKSIDREGLGESHSGTRQPNTQETPDELNIIPRKLGSLIPRDHPKDLRDIPVTTNRLYEHGAPE